MTTLPLVLLFATGVFGYSNIRVVDLKPLESSTKSDLENRISNEGRRYISPAYSGNEGQSGFIGNEENVNRNALPAPDTEIIDHPEGQIATGCFGVPEAVPDPTITNDLDQIIFPDNTAPPPLIGAYPPRPLTDPVPQFNDRNPNPNSILPPFPQIPPHPFMHHRYNHFMPPMFQRLAMPMPFFNRPPPVVIVKMMQPIILPVVKAVPEITTPTPDYEEIETNGRQFRRGRRFEGRRKYGHGMSFQNEVAPIIKTNTDDTMHISVKVY